MVAHVQRLEEALHRSETMQRDAYNAYMAKQQAARWERDQQILRQLADQRRHEEVTGDLSAARS
jgi:hypothetical protein